MKNKDRWSAISPADYRYWDKEIAQYLSEKAFMQYKLQAELALVKTFVEFGVCPQEVADEVESASQKITASDVIKEEKKTRHDVRALVNCILSRVSKKSKSYVHLGVTSYDIVDTANAARYRDAVKMVLLPRLRKVEKELIKMVLREAETAQIGRTHGQHAVPMTFGFAFAEYVNRLGSSIIKISKCADELVGKCSGAVGSYNALSLFLKNPEQFEKSALKKMGLKPSRHSTQIVPAEPMVRLLFEITAAAGVMANLADDLRHLQRTEIREVGESFGADQVGSSTMPQKQNPVTFENIKSCWKIVAPRMITVLMDQVSEHQRDLTNSASLRTYAELVNYASHMAKRLAPALERLKVDRMKMFENCKLENELVIAELIYVKLALAGYSNAHEKIRQVIALAKSRATSFGQALRQDAELEPYLENFDLKAKLLIAQPHRYVGLASRKARSVASYWQRRLNL